MIDDKITLPSFKLGPYQSAVFMRLAKMEEEKFAQRLNEKDETLWIGQNEEFIKNSLGWIDVVETMLKNIPTIKRFQKKVAIKGFKDVVLMGMGGSSLAPLVLDNIVKTKKNGFNFYVLDTTDPATIKTIENKVEIENTLFIVASKSGTTSEPLAFFNYFYHKVEQLKGKDAGENFIAITDEDSYLTRVAKEFRFLHVFKNYSDIGGRYSALSFFGILPASLMGINITQLLKKAQLMATASLKRDRISENPSVLLGGIVGELARLGRNKLTLVIPESFYSFGTWLEQLIAESTGKNGSGILPVITSKIGAYKIYGDDRAFVYFDVFNENHQEIEEKLNFLSTLGHPVITIKVNHSSEIGAEFYRWKIATAVSGAILQINPFDQENVQESKEITKNYLLNYQETGKMPESRKGALEGNIVVYSDFPSESGKIALKQTFNAVKPGDYIAIQAYLTETDEINFALQELRKFFQEKYLVPATLGFGPRYLHSTGQYHKGGPNNGVFIQITSKDLIDAPIPGYSYSFSDLKYAQALGDFEALLTHKRRAVRVDLGSKLMEGIDTLKRSIEEMYNIHYLETQATTSQMAGVGL